MRLPPALPPVAISLPTRFHFCPSLLEHSDRANLPIIAARRKNQSDKPWRVGTLGANAALKYH
tara:strand:+ start:923 stop:1111 length:189 start_codon:yes stop_codon:yes gene_type:complete